MGDSDFLEDPQATDSELVAETLAGDPQAFGPLIDRHMKPTFAVAYALTGSQAESDDLVQDALLNAYQDLPKLRLHEKFGQWLAGIVRKLAANRRRSAWRDRRVLRSYAERKEAEADLSFRAPASEGPSDLLWDGIQELSDELRVPLLLYYFEGHSTQAVAERLGLQPATARKRLQIARDKLRERLQKRWEGELQRLGPSPAIRASVMLAVATIPFAADAAAASESGASNGVGGELSSVSGGPTWQIAAVILVGVALLVFVGTQFPFGESASVTDATATVNDVAAGDTGGAETPVLGGAESGSATAGDSSQATGIPEPAAATGTVVGTVTRSDGESVDGLRVCLARNRDSWNNAQGVLVDAGGVFRFDVPAHENYWLYVELGGARICAPRPWVRPTASGVIERDIELDAGVTLSGALRCSVTGDPIPGATVLLKTPDPNQQGEAHVESAADGRFSVPFLPVGDYQLVFHHPEYTNDVRHVSLSAPAEQSFTLVPVRPMNLEILGLPEEFHGARATIAMKRLDDDPLAHRFRNREDFMLQGHVDARGVLRTQAPAPGTWEVTFFNTLPKYWTRLEILPGTDPVEHVCDLNDGGTIEGTVTPLDSVGGRGEVVIFDLADESAHGHRIAGDLDERGNFRFAGLPAGDYMLGLKEWLGGWPEDDEQYRWVNTFVGCVHLGPSQHVRVPVHLPEQSAVRFHVETDSPLHPSSHVLLRISPAGEEHFFSFDRGLSPLHDRSGVGVLAIVQPHDLEELTLRRLPPGRYRVEASIDERRFVSREIEVTGDELTQVVLPLPAPREAVLQLVTRAGVALPRDARLQCPPAPTRAQFPDGASWRRAHAAWISTAAIRDRLGDHEGTTHQVFARFYNDFAGWHFIRSLWLTDMRLEGTRLIEAGLVRVDLSGAATADTLRVLADGFEPVDIPIAHLTNNDRPVVVPLIPTP